MKINNYVNERMHDIKQAKRKVVQKDADYVFLSDQKNGVFSHYSKKINDVAFCSVSEKSPLKDSLVKDMMRNFWDSQPEYYRDFYEDLK